MEVKELMNPSVVTIEPTASAALAARLISRHNVGALPVCGADRRLRGMVTDRDIVLRCVAAEEDPAQTLVRDIMTRGCTAVSPRDDCREATRLMSVQQVRRLPVVEDGRLVGIVSLADLARSQRFDMEAAQALGEISENIIRIQPPWSPSTTSREKAAIRNSRQMIYKAAFASQRRNPSTATARDRAAAKGSRTILPMIRMTKTS